MRHDYDIIVLALSRWDGPYSSTIYSLSKEFARHQRVFYIDHPFTYKDFIAGRNTEQVINRKKALLLGKDIYKKPDPELSNLTTITPRLTIPSNFLTQGLLYDWCSKLNDRIVFSAIKKAINDFDIKKYIFINSFNPFYARHFPNWFKPELYVYQSVDDISQESYIARHGIRLETEAVRKAGLTLTTSTELCRIHTTYSNFVKMLPNAADISLFEKSWTEKFEKPQEIKHLNKKIIGYTGNIGLRIDYQLLKKIAQVHSDKILLMVGPLGNEEYKAHGLDKIENIIFTGSKKIQELPAYLQYIDCTIIPFECNKLTKSIYPLKINEYLASGKPVVSSAFSSDIKEFSEVAYIAENHNDFINLISKAISEDSPENRERRVNIARSNSWTSRVKMFWDIVEDKEGVVTYTEH